MSFFYNEIVEKLGLSPEETVGKKITVIDGRGVHIEGHRGVRKYSADEIVILIGKDTVRIFGANMRIVAVSREEVYIRGKIRGYEVENG